MLAFKNLLSNLLSNSFFNDVEAKVVISIYFLAKYKVLFIELCGYGLLKKELFFF